MAQFRQLSVVTILVFSACFETSAQDSSDPFTCFNAFEINFPLEQNDFGSAEIMVDNQPMNAVYYLYQDKYTFWYKLIAHEALTIDFTISPSNSKDRYRAMVFKYGGKDFCEKYVNQSIDPEKIGRYPIFEDNGVITYRNSVEAAVGDTFYVAVLSLNPDDCGHRFYTKTGAKSLAIHAVHQPCYNFAFLEIPDYSQARMELPDVKLSLDFHEDESEDLQTEASTKGDSAKSEFNSLKTIEVESEDDELVSVGDRLILNNVYFYNNTYALKPGAESELDELVAFLEFNPGLEIEVQGHTANHSDDIRPDPNFKGQGKAWNFKGSAFELSEKRAQAVRDYLINKGIDKSRIRAKGFGDTQKRVPNARTFEESEKNMRVEALVTKR